MTGDTLAQFSLHGMPLEAWSSNAVLLQAVLQDAGSRTAVCHRGGGSGLTQPGLGQTSSPEAGPSLP